jgi:hypothetical protein
LSASHLWPTSLGPAVRSVKDAAKRDDILYTLFEASCETGDYSRAGVLVRAFTHLTNRDFLLAQMAQTAAQAGNRGPGPRPVRQ